MQPRLVTSSGRGSVAKKKNKIGDDFQNDVQAALQGLVAKKVCMPVRLYDTKAARGKFLPPQPGDFIVASQLGGHLLEVKASEVHSSLRQCLAAMLEPHQAAAARIWAMMGQPSWVLFYSQPEFRLELYQGKVAGECYASKQPLPKEGEEGGPLVVRRDTLTDLLFNMLTKSRRQ